MSINWKQFWRHKLPPRVQHFMWKFLHNCLPTRSRLSRFTVHQDTLYPLCDQNVECIQHLFLDCRIARTVWNKVNSVLLNQIMNFDLYDWICGFLKVGNNGINLVLILISLYMKQHLSIYDIYGKSDVQKSLII